MVEKTPLGSFWPSLHEPFRHLSGRLAEWLSPAAEASSNDTTYSINMELPGVAEKDIKLTVDNGMVSVRGEKRSEREEKGDTWYFSERQFGAFERSFRLPADVDEDAIRADLKDGILTITMPRKARSDKTAKQIEIGKA